MSLFLDLRGADIHFGSLRGGRRPLQQQPDYPEAAENRLRPDVFSLKWCGQVLTRGSHRSTCRFRVRLKRYPRRPKGGLATPFRAQELDLRVAGGKKLPWAESCSKRDLWLEVQHHGALGKRSRGEAVAPAMGGSKDLFLRWRKGR